VDAIGRIAEDRIRRAMEDGLFDNLAGAGGPLDLEADAWVPPDLRLAYRVLKNAGCLPPELEVRQDIINLRMLIDAVDDPEHRARRLRELEYKLQSFNLMREQRGAAPLQLQDYEDRVMDRLMGQS
jgi:hypothetical protein